MAAPEGVFPSTVDSNLHIIGGREGTTFLIPPRAQGVGRVGGGSTCGQVLLTTRHMALLSCGERERLNTQFLPWRAADTSPPLGVLATLFCLAEGEITVFLFVEFLILKPENGHYAGSVLFVAVFQKENKLNPNHDC